MTNDDAIIVLQNDAYLLYEDDDPYDRQAYNLAIEALEAQKWIPVTERLPEDLQDVLCINKYHFYLVGWLTLDAAGNYKCETDGELMFDVTHWMPLPSPPKADKDGAE